LCIAIRLRLSVLIQLLSYCINVINIQHLAIIKIYITLLLGPHLNNTEAKYSLSVCLCFTNSPIFSFLCCCWPVPTG